MCNVYDSCTKYVQVALSKTLIVRCNGLEVDVDFFFLLITILLGCNIQLFMGFFMKVFLTLITSGDFFQVCNCYEFAAKNLLGLMIMASGSLEKNWSKIKFFI